jgi:hypothetical protein
MLGEGIKRAQRVCFHAHNSYYRLMDAFNRKNLLFLLTLVAIII